MSRFWVIAHVALSVAQVDILIVALRVLDGAAGGVHEEPDVRVVRVGQKGLVDLARVDHRVEDGQPRLLFIGEDILVFRLRDGETAEPDLEVGVLPHGRAVFVFARHAADGGVFSADALRVVLGIRRAVVGGADADRLKVFEGAPVQVAAVFAGRDADVREHAVFRDAVAVDRVGKGHGEGGEQGRDERKEDQERDDAQRHDGGLVLFEPPPRVAEIPDRPGLRLFVLERCAARGKAEIFRGKFFCQQLFFCHFFAPMRILGSRKP